VKFNNRKLSWYEIKLRPFYHTDLQNTFENIVFTEKPYNGKGILEKVFSDKSKDN